MKAATILAAVALVALVLTATAFAGNPDPRKCVLNSARACGEISATHGVRIAMSHRLGLQFLPHHDPPWDADITCAPQNAKFLLWGCTWKGKGRNGAATVRFWATSTGWHTRVTLTQLPCDIAPAPCP